jgi:hypothetical protein
MNVYRVIFFKTRMFTLQHFDANAETANHYHVMKNNKKIGEQSELYKAVKMILDDTGENGELQSLMRKAYLLRKPDPLYQCTGITFWDKHGLKIEMKLKESSNENLPLKRITS